MDRTTTESTSTEEQSSQDSRRSTPTIALEPSVEPQTDIVSDIEPASKQRDELDVVITKPIVANKPQQSQQPQTRNRPMSRHEKKQQGYTGSSRKKPEPAPISDDYTKGKNKVEKEDSR